MNENTIKLLELDTRPSSMRVADLSEAGPLNTRYIHRHTYWEIFLFKKGSGTHMIDFDETDFKARSIHFVLPHQVHQLKRVEDAEGLVLMVPDDLFHASNENRLLIAELGNHQLLHKAPIIHFSEEDFTAMMDIAQHMYKENYNPDREEAIVLKNYLNILLYKCRKNMTLANTSPGKRSELELFISFRHFVEQYFQKYTKIQDYLKLLGVNDRKLFAVCSFYAGMSPSDYLHRRILAEAKRLLLFSTTCQKEIAYSLNFTDLSHFIKFFKQKTGLLPKEFASGNFVQPPQLKKSTIAPQDLRILPV